MFTDVFFIIAKRGPLRDEDCYWDYGKARCSWPEYCEYRFFSFSTNLVSDNYSDLYLFFKIISFLFD